MIFVTIGTQEPFDRLIKAIDEIAPFLCWKTVIVQAPLKSYRPKNFKTLDFLDPKEFENYFEKADLIVAHAGMGTIISALVKEKPIIVMPRRLKYGEHRNEHQLATANKLKSLNFLYVVDNEQELQQILLTSAKDNFKPLHKLGKFASPNLIESIKTFIDS